MHAFNREKVLQLINSDTSLSEMYLSRTAENGRDVEDALSFVYELVIIGNTKYEEKYEALFDPMKDDEEWASMMAQLGPDSPVVAEIRRLVNEYGWRGFIRGLAQYAYKKGLEKKALGLSDDVAAWASVHSKVSKLRKGVKL